MLLPQQLSQQDKKPRSLSLFLLPEASYPDSCKREGQFIPSVCLCDLLALKPDVSEGLRQEGRM